jgi:hypothetical protein
LKGLASDIRNGKKITKIINLGTGGSDLGPRLLADAFGDGALDVRFVANIDPVELERALAGAVPDTTLIVAVSKTFSTQETIANAAAVRGLGNLASQDDPATGGARRGDDGGIGFVPRRTGDGDREAEATRGRDPGVGHVVAIANPGDAQFVEPCAPFDKGEAVGQHLARVA